MNIRFKKERNKASILSCVRDDGSVSWTKLHPNIEIHDLAHYVVETELGFQRAFYGLVNSGFDIQDFELAIEDRPKELVPKNLPVEALQTEHLVNLIQVHFQNNIAPDDFVSMLETILSDAGLPMIKGLTTLKVQGLIEKIHVLYQNWTQLADNESLELIF